MNQNKFERDLVGSILNRYGLEYQKILEVQSGYRNHSYKIERTSGTFVNLIIFKAETDIVERINRADQVSGYLAHEGLPVRVRIDQRIIKLQKQFEELPNYAALYNYLPGATISWEAYTQDHLKALGLAMARMHSTLSENDSLTNLVASETTIYSVLVKLLTRIEGYFSNDKVQIALHEKLHLELSIDYKRLMHAVAAADNLSRQHVLHMDFVRGNVIFNSQPTSDAISFGKAHISGIIDFEKTTYGNPVLDVARTLAFLLVDCKYKSAEKIRKYFLYSGYMKHGKGLITSEKLLDEYVRLFLLHDFYKFLLHNPYEYLAKNQHYLRTRDILLSQNMLEYKV